MGFLRFVLESEGYDVVAQASSAAELARVLAVHRPDVVVLDDGIGATAVQMTHDVSPGAKVILVWPGAVVPVGGYARVDPGDVLRSLGPTVARAVGTMAAPRESVITSDWTDRVRKDPADLREEPDEQDALPGTHPSVTELRRRGQHLHPVADPRPVDAGASSPDAADTARHPVGDVPADDLAPVLPLSALSMPPAAWASTMGEGVAASIATGGGPSEPVPAGAGDWNHRLGVVALGGAVAASAVVIALTLGASGAHQGILSAAGFVQEPQAAVVPAPGASLVGGIGQAGLFTRAAGVIPVPPSGPVAPGNGGSPGGGGGHPGGGGTGGGGTGSGGPGGGGSGGGGGGGLLMPGRSALHNPFGGPPGHLRSHATGPNHGGAHGNSATAHDHASQRGNSGAHASQNGQSHRHKR